jgi:hypothetical protein
MTFHPKSGDVVGVPAVVADPPRAFGFHHVAHSGANRCVENVAPWLSAEEWDAIGKLARASVHYSQRREAYLAGSVVRDLDEAWSGFQHALANASPVITRMGW